MRFLKVVLVVASALPLACYAALGAAPGTGAASQSLLRAATAGPVSSSLGYTMRVSRDANGVTVREYVLPTNVVFAVTWDGPVRPDMTSLLGSYFPRAVSTSAARGRGTGPLIERSGDFHIESAGAPGHASGKAFLPRLVPANVRIEDLQ